MPQAKLQAQTNLYSKIFHVIKPTIKLLLIYRLNKVTEQILLS